MKYTKPQLEIIQLETNDIVASSREETISVGDITITGPKEEFATDFSDLLRF